MATFAEYLATGSGAVGFRLVIEGCPFEFVTDPGMEGPMTDGRIRVRGLLRSGISIDESAYIPGAELNLKLSSMQIVETDGPYLDAATRAFTGYGNASVQSFLAEDVLDTDLTAKVRASEPFTVGDVVHVGTEAWKVTVVEPSGTTSPSTISITRGYWRTTAQKFVIAVPGSTRVSTNVIEVYDAPPNYAGRRVWLYGHGTSEQAFDPAVDTDGYLLWRGVLANNPELTDSRTWSLSMQSRLALFDAEIGKGSDGGTRLRGIYYPGSAPFVVYFGRRSGATRDSSSMSDAAVVYIVGFYETQQAFCDALTAACAANADLISWGVIVTARPAESGMITGGPTINAGTWDLFISPNFGSPKWIDVQGGSPVDGAFDQAMYSRFIGSAGIVMWAPRGDVSGLIDLRCGWGSSPTGWPASIVPAENARQVPRGCYQEWFTAAGTGGFIPDSAFTLYPRKRFYLDFASALGGWGTVKITPPSLDPAVTPDAIDAPIGTYSTAGYIEITDTSIALPAFGGAGEYGPTFELTAAYGPLASLTGCNLAQFMDAVRDAAPLTANIGGPFITDDDVADWNAAVLQVTSGHPTLQRRIYSFTKPKKLIDIIREECKLHGLYLALDADGLITVRPLPAASSDPLSVTLDSTVHAPGDDFGTFKLAPDGIVTQVTLKSGYIPADDKWQNEWDFIALGGRAQTKGKGQPLTVAPYSRPFAPSADGGDLTYEEADAHFQGVLALWGSLYYYVDLPVTIRQAHALRLGDECLATVKQLPYAGARAQNTPGAGMTNVRAFVVGRSWQYGDSPTGVLTLLLQAKNTAGYTPTARVDSATGGGASWVLTVTTTLYSTTTDASYFAAGMRIVLREWDAENPATYAGTVSSVVGNAITVNLETGFPGLLGRTLVLGFDGAPNGITVAQQAFAYMADPTGRITYASGGVSPRVFA